MSIILSILLIALCLYSYTYNKYNMLFFLIVLSLFGDIFEFQIGVALKLHHFIVLLSLPKLLVYYIHSIHLKKYLKYLVVEFALIFILGVIFGFIVPFDDPYAASRTFTQTSAMRAIISSVRMLLELSTIILVIYWINTKKINLDLIIKTISIVLIINVTVAVIDFYSGFIIKNFINYDGRNLQGRFLGLSGEPRGFGRYCSFSLIFLLFFRPTHFAILRKVALYLSIIGVILSFSASSILITIVGLSIYLYSQREFKLVFISIVLMIIAFGFLKTNEFFQTDTFTKINMVIGSNENNKKEKVSLDEPDIFSSFEVFDRAALNFFYHHPGYLLFGTGPNLISIPASPYLTQEAAAIYEYGINSVPHSMFVNILSRSGIIGIVLNILFFIVVFKKINVKRNKYFFSAIFIMSLLVGTSIFYFYIGLTIAPIIRYDKIQNLKANLKLRLN